MTSRTDKEAGIVLLRHDELDVDWGGLIKSVSKAGLSGLLAWLGIIPNASGIFTNLLGSLDAVKFREDPGYQAWQLSLLAFGWSLDELTQTDDAASSVKSELRAALELLKRNSETEDFVMPASFLRTPATLPLYRQLRDF
jgi:hypothetical protein